MCSGIVGLDVHFLELNCACTFIYIYMRTGVTSVHNGCVTCCLLLSVLEKCVYKYTTKYFFVLVCPIQCFILFSIQLMYNHPELCLVYPQGLNMDQTCV